MDSKKKNGISSKQSDLDDKSRELLLKELDILKELCLESDHRIESLFNSYLTFLTAVVGGLAILSQFVAQNKGISMQLLSAILFLFIAVVGMMYSLSIAHRYADLVRYAIGGDELRKYLLFKNEPISLPNYYDHFKESKYGLDPSGTNFTYWLRPVGTYHFFTVFLNSTALAVSVGLYIETKPYAINNPLLVILTPILFFWVILLTQNYLARRSRQDRVIRLNLLLNEYRLHYVREPMNKNVLASENSLSRRKAS